MCVACGGFGAPSKNIYVFIHTQTYIYVYMCVYLDIDTEEAGIDVEAGSVRLHLAPGPWK